jgi:hypothetical protein
VIAQAPSYTLVLTKGAHIVSADDAQAICEAIEAGKKLVRVAFEEYPGSKRSRPTTLALAHVISLCEVPETRDEVAEAAGPNVLALRARLG